MRAYLALLRVNFQNLLVSSLAMGGRRSRRVAGAGALGLIAGLMVFISASTAIPIMADPVIREQGGLRLVMYGMLLMGLMLPIVFTVMAAQGVVYSAKDVDLVFSLPVSAFSVMLARVSALYLESLLLVECLVLPAGIAYVVFGGTAWPLFLPLLALLGALWALLPTMVALVFGFVVSAVVSRLRFKNLFTVVFSFLLMLGILAASFSIGSVQEDTVTAASLADLTGRLGAGFPPMVWLMDGATGSGPLGILLLLAATLLPFLALVWLFSRFYKRMMTNLMSHRIRSDYKLGRMKAAGGFAALVQKEAARFLGTPVYLLNCGVSLVMAAVLSGAALVFRGRIAEGMEQVVAQAEGFITLEQLQGFIAPLLLACMAFFLIMLYATAVSISLEGKNLWVLLASPLGERAIFGAKIAFNLILSWGITLVCTPLLGLAFGLPPFHVLLIIAVCLPFAVFCAATGLYINLKHPLLDAISDASVVKNSASALLGMLAGLGGALLATGVYLAASLGLGLGFAGSAGLVCLALLLMAAWALYRLDKKGTALFRALGES